MQDLLSKMLAGEVTQPGTFSKRTIATVQHMSPSELSWFQRLGALAWRNEGAFFLPRDDENSNPFLDYGVPYHMVLHLGGMGLVMLEGASLRLVDGMDLRFGETLFEVVEARGADISIFPLTAVAGETLRALKVTYDERFIEPAIRLFRRSGAIIAEFVERYAREILARAEQEGIRLTDDASDSTTALEP